MKYLFFIISFLSYITSISANHINNYTESPCDLDYYPSLCKSELIHSCYDCYHKNNFEQDCAPVFDSVLETLEKYPRNDWNCTLHEPNNNEYTSQKKDEISYRGKVYYACSGSICMRKGWMNYIKHNNNYWCGLGRCFKTHKHVVCDRPQYCDKEL